MYIYIKSHELELRNAEDFTDFHVESSEPRLDFNELPGLTSVGQSQVAVDLSTIVGLAGTRASDPQWSESLKSMIAFARSKGWTTDTGAILGHVVHSDSAI